MFHSKLAVRLSLNITYNEKRLWERDRENQYPSRTLTYLFQILDNWERMFFVVIRCFVDDRYWKKSTRTSSITKVFYKWFIISSYQVCDLVEGVSDSRRNWRFINLNTYSWNYRISFRRYHQSYVICDVVDSGYCPRGDTVPIRLILIWLFFLLSEERSSVPRHWSSFIEARHDDRSYWMIRNVDSELTSMDRYWSELERSIQRYSLKTKT